LLARVVLVLVWAAWVLVWPLAAQPTTLPNRAGSLKFAVIGDSGSGAREQYEVGARMADARGRFAFDLVIMLGDNLYNGDSKRDYERDFELPYKSLLDSGVTFYAALGNHDSRDERLYRGFNMGGRTYYSFAAPAQSVRFFALESDYMHRAQLQWIEQELSASTEAWKIVFMHHPLYSSGKTHGSEVPLRKVLEPLFRQHGVSAVFAGHEHFYERITPQNGIAYFTSGGAGKLRKNDIRKNSPLTAAGFDTDNHFMLVEIDGDEMFFEAMARTGKTVDSGVARRRAVGSELRVPGS
jgi:3',5'-cyclic AMP phosphodiesterase CpdA